MTPKKDSFNIVVLGAWNPIIFSPDWVLNKIIQRNEGKIKLAFPVDDPDAPRKLSFEGINILPSRKSLYIMPDTPSLDNLLKCSEVLIKILEELEHTPIAATGINFSFSENHPTEQLINALNGSDRGSILDSYLIKGINLNRVLIREGENYALNFAISENEESHILNFNFHHETTNINDCHNVIDENTIRNYHTESIRICKDIYGIEMGDTE